MIDKFNNSGKQPFVARFAVPSDFEAVVAKRPTGLLSRVN